MSTLQDWYPGDRALDLLLIVAFGVSALACGGDAAGGRVRFREAPPLAPAALRLAAGLPRARWRTASLAAPIYSRPPATTAPKARSKTRS